MRRRALDVPEGVVGVVAGAAIQIVVAGLTEEKVVAGTAGDVLDVADRVLGGAADGDRGVGGAVEGDDDGGGLDRKSVV